MERFDGSERRGEEEEEAGLGERDVKPPYRIPSMVAVRRATGTAGLSVVSTFTGAGGSCLGFEMAGYRVVWANEFVAAARDTYWANHPQAPLDGRDIRNVKPEEILHAAGLERGELDVLQGSPPCASFSTMGLREKHWGTEQAYSGTKQRTDDLFFEFVRLLRGLAPRAFVAENVVGITQGVAVGYFRRIMSELTASGYRVRCRVLDAKWLGVPQSRSRAIFVGVRDDLGLAPEHPKPLPYCYTLGEVLPHLSLIPSGPVDESGPEWLSKTGVAVLREWDKLRAGEQSKRFFSLQRATPEAPSPCIMAADGKRTSIACVTVPHQARRYTLDELRVVCGFPADFVLTGTYAQAWERLGRAVPPPMMRAIARTLRDGLFAKLGRTRPDFKEAA